MLRNRLHNNTWGTYVQHKGRVQQAKLLNFLNSFYFSAFSFYFTRVLDPHPNKPRSMILRGDSEKFEYLSENGTKIENILTIWSVAQAGSTSNNEKTGGKKSR